MIWLLDAVLKIALGHLIAYLIWLPFHWIASTPYGVGWLVAGGILGVCIVGFFEGCDLILLGLAKRITGQR
jgi:hypothetical protein